jgi:NADPH2 dehydrogenase
MFPEYGAKNKYPRGKRCGLDSLLRIPNQPSETDACTPQITDKVHANGSYIFLQLWALGRVADVEALKSDDPSLELVAPSPIPSPDSPSAIPKALTTSEIDEFVQLYAQAAKNAVFEAGFDGVEIHGANGYLIDQFLQDVSNQRTDAYGGSVERRSKFGLAVVDAVVNAVGAERTAIRLSPWSPYQGNIPRPLHA